MSQDEIFTFVGGPLDGWDVQDVDESLLSLQPKGVYVREGRTYLWEPASSSLRHEKRAV